MLVVVRGRGGAAQQELTGATHMPAYCITDMPNRTGLRRPAARFGGCGCPWTAC